MKKWKTQSNLTHKSDTLMSDNVNIQKATLLGGF